RRRHTRFDCDWSSDVCSSDLRRVAHHDDGFSMSNAPEDVKTYVRQQILAFGPVELAKLLFYVDDLGFDRPSTGYSFMSVFGARRSEERRVGKECRWRVAT